MVTIDIWKLYFSDEVQVSILEGDNTLDRKKFYFHNAGEEGQKEMTRFLTALKDHFGFKLTK